MSPSTLPVLTLANFREEQQAAVSAFTRRENATHIKIHTGTCGLAAGAEALLPVTAKTGIPVYETGCIGTCFAEPNVTVHREGMGSVIFSGVRPALLADIVTALETGAPLPLENAMARNGALPAPFDALPQFEDLPFFRPQKLLTMRNKGIVDPKSLEDYLARDGYSALVKAIRDMDAAGIIREVSESGIRGRGGGGFPTGRKWAMAEKQDSPKKYILCNADEGDPGAFMDRSILESDPHAVIEGMIIAALAIGSDEGVVYCRTEYPIAITMLTKAISDAEAAGILGDSVLGSDTRFHLRIFEGAGAFVCGEETALMLSIEGKRGMPRPRPPYPAESGLFGVPSVLNNVETLATIPFIIRNGAAAYSAHGTTGSKGTKVFALSGSIRRVGLAEVPMGIPLSTLIQEIGGGPPKGKTLKAVQLGGPSGGCIPAGRMDTPIDYEAIREAGAIMGSGGAIVVDSSTCMVDLARFFVDFLAEESCGKCTPCREGIPRLIEILDLIISGNGTPEHLELLESLSDVIKATSLCGLGQTGPNPVLSTLRHFREEYEAHVMEKRCPAKQCVALLKFVVNEELCRKCGKCAAVCPSGAISWEKKQAARIDRDICIRCRRCFRACPFDAIE